jgi:hypothetical protein
MTPSLAGLHPAFGFMKHDNQNMKGGGAHRYRQAPTQSHRVTVTAVTRRQPRLLSQEHGPSCWLSTSGFVLHDVVSWVKRYALFLVSSTLPDREVVINKPRSATGYRRRSNGGMLPRASRKLLAGEAKELTG